ncbi:MAG: FadR/GntR family transcriptional regulator [Desulfitobacteriaceae bacterium]
MDLEKVKPRRVYEDVLEQITKLMSKGKINPGDRLMGEREMANALGVSRTTLREALRTLEHLGLMEIKPGGGTFVKDQNLNQVIAPLALALSVEQNSFLDLWEVRFSLEVTAAGLAAQQVTPESLQYIEDALREMRSCWPDAALFSKADLRFHYMIAQASQNTMMSRLLQTFVVHLYEMSLKAGYFRFMHDREGVQTITEHTEIFEAIKSRDPERARQSMTEHLKGVRRDLKTVLDDSATGH